MKVLPEQQAFLQSAVREAVVANPMISIRKVQRVVKERTGRSIGDRYVSRLMEENRKLAVAQANRERLNARMEEVRARYAKHQEALYYIIYKTVGLTDRVLFPAMKLSAQLDLMLLRAEIIAGAFESQSGVVEIKEQMGISRTLTLRPQSSGGGH